MMDISKAIVVNDHNWDFGIDTIIIPLNDTLGLCETLDAIRIKKGHLPMLAKEDSEYDRDGWYCFYAFVSEDEGSHDVFVIGYVESGSAKDDGDSYTVPLTDEEKVQVYDELDRQLKERYGVSIDGEIEKARII